MDIYKRIISSLKEEYEAGATYQELAEKYGVSLSYVRELLAGIKPVERLSLETFFKLFPGAAIALDGGIAAPVVNNGHNAGTMNGVVNGSRQDLRKILDSEDLNAEEKVKMLKVLVK